MDRHDGVRLRRDGGGYFFRVDVVAVWNDVDENGFCVQPSDGAGGGDETEGRGDDLVSLANTRSDQGQDQGVRA